MPVMVPELGASSPASMRSRVLFPQPLGPIKARNDPTATSSDSESTATTPLGNVRETFETRIVPVVADWVVGNRPVTW